MNDRPKKTRPDHRMSALKVAELVTTLELRTTEAFNALSDRVQSLQEAIDEALNNQNENRALIADMREMKEENATLRTILDNKEKDLARALGWIDRVLEKEPAESRWQESGMDWDRQQPTFVLDERKRGPKIEG